MYAQFARARGRPGKPVPVSGPLVEAQDGACHYPTEGARKVGSRTGGQTRRETRGSCGSCDGAVSEGVKV